MAHHAEALSMSWRVARAIRQEGWTGEVIAVHARSCYLMGDDSDIYAVVAESLGNGPLNVVIPAATSQWLSGLSAGSSAASSAELLLLGDSLEIGLEHAALWDPKAYPALGADLEGLRRSLAEIFRTASADSPGHSLARLLPYLDEEDLPSPLDGVIHFPRSHALIAGLRDALVQRNRRSLKVVASSLAGLGSGLTPSGDDFLAGVLLAIALAQEHQANADLGEIGALLLETAAARTHEISGAHLRTALAGEVGERWHPLIAAISAGNAERAGDAALSVMKIGETSGADMLAGFLVGMGAVHQFSPAAWQEAAVPAAGSRLRETPAT
jgi:Protein of unknown function (DUF2877)